MNRVLVPLAIRKTAENSAIEVHFARDSYIRKLTRAGLVPVFVSPVMPRRAADALYAECSGVLFMGGKDFDARHYRKKNHPWNDRGEPERDKLELYLLKKVLKDKKPFLGICRGCQALAIASGGTLFQHIPDLKTGEEHNVKKYDDMALKNFHTIRLEEGSVLRRLFGKASLKVNTGHHQAVRALGPGFAVSAVSPAGIVEAIERKDKGHFCIGIQSHPEMMPRGHLDKLFAAFARAVVRYRGRKFK